MGDSTLLQHGFICSSVSFRCIQAINVRFDNPLTPAGVEQLGFDSAWRYALGVQYRPNDRWTLRSGAAFDESPAPNAALRSARLPDADRSWLSAGVSYQVDPRYSIDFGYSHLFVKDVSIDRLGTTQDRLTGDYDILDGYCQLAVARQLLVRARAGKVVQRAMALPAHRTRIAIIYSGMALK